MSSIEDRSGKQRLGWTLGLLAFAQLIISVDYNIVYVALPKIGPALGLGEASLQWVVSAYALAFGGFLLLGGRACDRLGARRVYLAGLALYAVGSMAGGLAATAGWIVAARAVQGAGGALLFPAVLTLISTRFPAGPERHRAFAVWGTTGGAGMVLGSLAGGVLTGWFGWPSVFFVNVPLAIATIALSLWAITPDQRREPSKGCYDLGGAVAGTAGVTLIILGLVQASKAGRGLLGASAIVGVGIVLLAAFALIERRTRDPLVPAGLLRHGNLVAGMAVTGLYMASFGTLLYFLTIYFQNVQGFSAFATGLAFLPPMVGIAAGAQLGGRLVTRWGPRAVMVTSMAIGAAGIALLAAQLAGSPSYAALVPALVVLGLGQGSGWTVMFAGATSGIDESGQGTASGLACTTQQIGGAAGLAVLVAVSTWVGGGSEQAVMAGLRAALLAAAGLACLTGVAALGFTGRAPVQQMTAEPTPQPAEPAPGPAMATTERTSR